MLREIYSTKLATDASASTPAVGFAGGKTAIVSWFTGGVGVAPGTLKIQLLAGEDGTPVDAVGIATVGVMQIADLPKGKYQLVMAGGVPAHVNVVLTTIPHT